MPRDHQMHGSGPFPRPGPQQGSGTAGSVEIVNASTIAPKPISWLWKGWLARGKLHLIAGAVATGKTTIAIDFAATITAGRKWPDGSAAEIGDALMWSGEDDLADSLLPRFLVSGGDKKRMSFVQGVIENGKHRPFDPSEDIPALAHQAQQLSDLRLLIIDPIVMAVAGDSHKNAETRRGLQPLVDLAGAMGCAVLGITHFTKGTSGRDPTERVTGSLAFGALARLVMATAKPTEDETKRRLVRAKSNIGPDGGGFEYNLVQEPLPDLNFGGQKILWRGKLEGSARELLAQAEMENPDDGALGRARDFLLRLLSEGPMSFADIKKAAEANGHAWRTVERAKMDVGVVSKKSSGGKGLWTWSAPEEVPF